MLLFFVESVTRIAVNLALLRFLYRAIQCMEQEENSRCHCRNSSICAQTYAKIGKKMMADTL